MAGTCGHVAALVKVFKAFAALELAKLSELVDNKLLLIKLAVNILE